MKKSVTPLKSTNESFLNLEKILQEIENSIDSNCNSRKEVVFLPYKASHWASLETIWKSAMNDSEYDVYVIPIPWYYRKNDGTFQSVCQYEGDMFPEYIPITSYKDYDFQKRHPHTIIFQNPYDYCNYATSVDPLYYSSKLKTVTQNLVYLPWFTTTEIKSGDFVDQKALYNTKYYVTTPGVVHSDIVIVQSPEMRDIYIDILTQFAGLDTKTKWEDKIFDYSFSNLCHISEPRGGFSPSSDVWKNIKLITKQ